MLDALLDNNPWLALILWFGAVFSDYYLTLYGARLFQAAGKDHFSFEGSYELTPAYQGDIDSLRGMMNPRLLAILALSGLAIAGFWYLTVRTLHFPWAFSLLMGGLLMREGAVHLRHFSNIATFRAARSPGALTGHLTFARWVVLHQSSVEMWGFAGFCLLAYVFSGSLFLAGGALACALTAVQHSRLSKKAIRAGKPT